MNKKNGCAVAFVNGVPEFVRNLGNPFKLKVFPDIFVARDIVKIRSYSLELFKTHSQENQVMDEKKAFGLGGQLPCAIISLD